MNMLREKTGVILQWLLPLRACCDYNCECNDDYEKAQGEVGQEVLLELLLLKALCIAGCWNFNDNVDEGQNEVGYWGLTSTL